jgi:hypothetical protein
VFASSSPEELVRGCDSHGARSATIIGTLKAEILKSGKLK